MEANHDNVIPMLAKATYQHTSASETEIEVSWEHLGKLCLLKKGHLIAACVTHLCMLYKDVTLGASEVI